MQHEPFLMSNLFPGNLGLFAKFAEFKKLRSEMTLNLKQENAHGFCNVGVPKAVFTSVSKEEGSKCTGFIIP